MFLYAQVDEVPAIPKLDPKYHGDDELLALETPWLQGVYKKSKDLSIY
jgi:hypothetical protein